MRVREVDLMKKILLIIGVFSLLITACSSEIKQPSVQVEKQPSKEERINEILEQADATDKQRLNRIAPLLVENIEFSHASEIRVEEQFQKLYGDNPYSLNLEIDAEGKTSKEIKEIAYKNSTVLLEKLKEINEISYLQFNYALNVTDNYGNKKKLFEGIKINFRREEMDKINFYNFNYMNVPKVTKVRISPNAEQLLKSKGV